MQKSVGSIHFISEHNYSETYPGLLMLHGQERAKNKSFVLRFPDRPYVFDPTIQFLKFFCDNISS